MWRSLIIIIAEMHHLTGGRLQAVAWARLAERFHTAMDQRAVQSTSFQSWIHCCLLYRARNKGSNLWHSFLWLTVVLQVPTEGSEQLGRHRSDIVGSQAKPSPHRSTPIPIIEHIDEAAVSCKIYHGLFKLWENEERKREEDGCNALQGTAECLAAHCGRKQPRRFMADWETTTESFPSSKLKSWVCNGLSHGTRM